MVFHTRGLGGCARAHPPGVAPEALGEWIYSPRGFSYIVRGVNCVYRAHECEFGSLGLSSVAGRALEPLRGARGRSGVSLSFLLALTHPFRSEGGVEGAMLPSVGASSDTSGELLLGKFKWRPAPHLIGVG